MIAKQSHSGNNNLPEALPEPRAASAVQYFGWWANSAIFYARLPARQRQGRSGLSSGTRFFVTADCNRRAGEIQALANRLNKNGRAG
jgi:hypothetical protein